MKSFLVLTIVASIQIGCNRQQSSPSGETGTRPDPSTPAADRPTSEKLGAERPNRDTELGDGREEEDGGSTGSPAGGQGVPIQE